MGTPTANQLFEATHSGIDSPNDPNLFTMAELGATPVVADSAARDALFPTPVGDEKVEDRSEGDLKRYDTVSASWVRRAYRVKSARYVALGDSITLGDASASLYAGGSRSWFTLACVLSNQRIQHIRNAGVAGETTSQWAARVTTDVIAYSPDRCFLTVGSPNDLATLTLAQTRANIQSIVAQLLRVGILPTLISMAPSNTAGQLANIAAQNQWGANYAASMGLDFIDVHKTVVNAANGNWVAANTVDGTHPSNVGARLMAQEIVDRLAGALPARRPYLASSDATGSSLLTAGCFSTDTNADGIPDSWVISGTVTGGSETHSLVTDATATGVLGKWQQVVASALVGVRSVTPSVQTPVGGSNFAVGDKVAIAMRLQVTGAEAGLLVYHLKLRFGSSSVFFAPLYNSSTDIADGTAYMEGLVPAGATTLFPQIDIVSGTGTIRWGQITVTNLTALGF